VTQFSINEEERERERRNNIRKAFFDKVEEEVRALGASSVTVRAQWEKIDEKGQFDSRIREEKLNEEHANSYSTSIASHVGITKGRMLGGVGQKGRNSRQVGGGVEGERQIIRHLAAVTSRFR